MEVSLLPRRQAIYRPWRKTALIAAALATVCVIAGAFSLGARTGRNLGIWRRNHSLHESEYSGRHYGSLTRFSSISFHFNSLEPYRKLPTETTADHVTYAINPPHIQKPNKSLQIRQKYITITSDLASARVSTPSRLAVRQGFAPLAQHSAFSRNMVEKATGKCQAPIFPGRVGERE
eukprot:1392477-Amorphochlora_amoeboformis.AAC.2